VIPLSDLGRQNLAIITSPNNLTSPTIILTGKIDTQGLPPRTQPLYQMVGRQAYGGNVMSKLKHPGCFRCVGHRRSSSWTLAAISSETP